MIRYLLPFILLFLTNCQSENRWTCVSGDCIDGYGKRTWSDGGIEEGIWKNGKLDGQGYQFFGKTSEFSEDSYTGDFKDDAYHGYGTYYDNSEDSKYVGELENGKPHGQGKLTFGEESKYPGRFYDGQWVNGQRMGRGTKFWGSQGEFANNRYQGEWLDNEMHGIGRYEWADGSYYQGPWKNGEQDGNGVYVYPNGAVFKGHWDQGYCKELARRLKSTAANTK